MIKYIFKMIWIERNTNLWILLELILVFCILWFCVDYLYFTTKRYFEPRGFDIEHTYRIGIGMKDEGREIEASEDEAGKEQMLNDIWDIFDRIKKYPAIENISYSFASHPYSGSAASWNLPIDSVIINFQYKRVTPEFFDVFRIKINSGVAFDWNTIVSDNPVVISPERNDMLGKKYPQEIEYLNPDKEYKQKVSGVAEKSKLSEYADYGAVTYHSINKDNSRLISNRELCVRVKPETDNNFVEQFTNDMRKQLEVGNYYLSSIRPIEKDREEYLAWLGYTDNFKSIYSICAFLIINIFLGIVGTFWFRIQSRRGDIGLHIAIGASKAEIKKIFITEAVFLLFVASIIATAICANIAMADILKNIGVPAVDGGEEATFSRHIINYLITFGFLALIAIVAVWYPAKKASDIQPVEALREE